MRKSGYRISRSAHIPARKKRKDIGKGEMRIYPQGKHQLSQTKNGTQEKERARKEGRRRNRYQKETFLHLHRYWSDFQFTVLNVSELGKTKRFETSLHYIFEMIKYSKDKEGLKQYLSQHKEQLAQLDSVEATAAFALLGQNNLVEKLMVEERTEGGMSMCIAIDEMIRDGEQRGLEKGKTK